MHILFTVVHIIVCVFLIIIVLLQSGKAADIAGAFGGMGSQTAFGPRGAATVLSKATTVAAVVFMLTSIVLSISAARRGGFSSSVLDTQKTTAPRTPANTTAPPTGTQTPLRPGQPVDIQLTPPTKSATPPQPASKAPATAPAPAKK
jgi:preprotein translocase subunit SecG